MKKRLLILSVPVIVGVILSFMLYQRADAPAHGERMLTLASPGGRTEEVAVEVADDDAERARGLMERDTLAPGTGMLFVYEEDAELAFWMKNTRIPLDILFFTGSGDFVSRTTMEPCTADPCSLYFSSALARYALEVNEGEPLTAEIGEGWRILLP